jgi:Peptidase family M1 domain
VQYFHNWTGNRVTCRDWFQLTLKEGLTVFRDQEFSGDMNSKAVNRIENVRALRARQFAEDAGPMSHPIRPESYVVRVALSENLIPVSLIVGALQARQMSHQPPTLPVPQAMDNFYTAVSGALCCWQQDSPPRQLSQSSN